MLTEKPKPKSKRFPVFTLNVGNTHTKLIGWGENLAPDWLAWKTDGKRPNLAAFFAANATTEAAVVLAGVVPSYKEALAREFLKFDREILIFRRDLKPRIDIIPSPPEKVGDDRIAGALGALAIDPKRPWVTVDVGTAMTVNAVRPGINSKPPRFEGGLIVPGATTSLLALGEFTAQLPQFERLPVIARVGASFIGRNTKDAMILGVYHAQLAAAIALAKGQLKELGPRARIALTGGGANDLRFSIEFCKAFPPGRVIPHFELVHFGLYSAWKDAHAHG
jgi:pantothenate kinase type III